MYLNEDDIKALKEVVQNALDGSLPAIAQLQAMGYPTGPDQMRGMLFVLTRIV